MGPSFDLLALTPLLDLTRVSAAAPEPIDFLAELADWLNTLALGNFWAGYLPQGEPLPSCVLNLITENRIGKLSGLAGLTGSTFQVDCYAASHGVAAIGLEAVAARLVDYRGMIGRARVQTIIRQDGMTRSDPFDNGTGRMTQRLMGQFCAYWTA